MYARDDQPLPPILTDGLWGINFEFYAGSVAAPLDQTGSTWSLVFAPKGQGHPVAADVHELKTGAGNGITVLGNLVQVSWSTWTTWTPGTYAVELRQTDGVSPVPVYVGAVTLVRGLSDLPTLGGGAALPPGAAPGVQLFVGPKAIQVVRGDAVGSAASAAASAAAADAARQVVDPIATSVAAVSKTLAPAAAQDLFAAAGAPKGRWWRNRGPADVNFVTGGTAVGAVGEITVRAGERIVPPYRCALNVSVISTGVAVLEGEEWS